MPEQAQDYRPDGTYNYDRKARFVARFGACRFNTVRSGFVTPDVLGSEWGPYVGTGGNVGGPGGRLKWLDDRYALPVDTNWAGEDGV